jgi:hypothetical protein
MPEAEDHCRTLLEAAQVPKTLYCWRCQRDIPMLDEQEWQRLVAKFPTAESIKAYREQHGVALDEARRGAFAEALASYRALTGFAESEPNALWHHRISLYGPPCAHCGKPFRTPVARRRLLCGTDRADRGA